MASQVGVFLEQLSRAGLEKFGRFYGLYRAIVTRNDDPEERGRIQALCPAAGQDIAPDVWIDPAFATAGADHGSFYPPEKGDAVRVSFECGDPGRPDVYLGGWYGNDDLPVEFSYSNGRPERRGHVSRAGHALIFCDESDAERVRLLWHKPDPSDASLNDPTRAADRTKGKYAFLSLNPDGSIQLVNQNGSNINIDATNEALVLMDQHGNTITLDGDGIKLVDRNGNYVILGSGEVTTLASKNVHLMSPNVNIKAGTVAIGDKAAKSVVYGEDLLQWLNLHTHPTGVGPSGPPMAPALPRLLSPSVKVK